MRPPRGGLFEHEHGENGLFLTGSIYDEVAIVIEMARRDARGPPLSRACEARNRDAEIQGGIHREVRIHFQDCGIVSGRKQVFNLISIQFNVTNSFVRAGATLIIFA